jgi:hypothetical protein
MNRFDYWSWLLTWAVIVRREREGSSKGIFVAIPTVFRHHLRAYNGGLLYNETLLKQEQCKPNFRGGMLCTKSDIFLILRVSLIIWSSTYLYTYRRRVLKSGRQDLNPFLG